LLLRLTGGGLSFGSPGNSATIHGSSSALYRGSRGGGGGGGDHGYPAAGARSAHRGAAGRYPSYGGYSPSSGSADEVQKETKYYYGGKYQGELGALPIRARGCWIRRCKKTFK